MKASILGHLSVGLKHEAVKSLLPPCPHHDISSSDAPGGEMIFKEIDSPFQAW